ncbi:hypothetical protein H6G81_00475 [Scytonema hofmannii FACHB-248]|uniref:Transposase n=1 Tax=Scytonema hofmannii FACHB-248 TaxID=1842502 RepID=A0ABR8GI48_9CYAN|nr:MULTISPECIES: hypothetical protein [Nostocales]MBD2603030.1 hypothetical protein [Scytonema hofmannii FACHB-248]
MQLFINQLSDRLSEELVAARKLNVRPLTVSDREFETTVNAGTVKWAVREQRDLFIVPKYVQGQEISHTVLTNGLRVRQILLALMITTTCSISTITADTINQV